MEPPITTHRLPGRWLTAVLALMLWCLPGLAADDGLALPVGLGPEPPMQPVDLLPHARILRDPLHQLQIDDLTALPDEAFESPGSGIALGFTRDAVWLRLRLRVETEGVLPLVIYLLPMFVDSVELHADLPTGDRYSFLGGDHVPLAERGTPLRHPAFSLRLPQGETVVHVRLASRSTLSVMLRAQGSMPFVASALHWNLINGAIIGIGLAALLVALVCAVGLGSRILWLCSVYLALHAGYQFAINGYDQVWLYPATPWLADHVLGILATATGACLALFALALLGPDQRLKSLEMVLRVLALITLSIAGLGVFGLYPVLAPLANLLGIALLIVLLGYVLLQLSRRREGALPLLLMVGPGTVAAMLMLAGFLGWLPMGFWTSEFRNLASALQAPMAAVIVLGLLRKELTQRNEERVYRELIENQLDLVVKIDRHGCFEFVSPSYCETFGKQAADLIGRAVLPLVHEDDRAATAEAMRRLQDPPHAVYLEQRQWTARGWRWIGWSNTALPDSKGRVRSVIGVGRDVTDRIEAEQALAESMDRLNLALAAGRIGFYDVDLSQRSLVGDERCMDLLGLESHQAALDWKKWQELIHPDDLPQVRELTEHSMLDRGEAISMDYRMRHADGRWLWVTDRSSVTARAADGQATHMVGIIKDVSEHKNAEEQLAFLVDHDELTGLLNRRGIAAAARHSLARCRRNGEACCLAMLDLDHFKHINDNHGHEVGDEVLRAVSLRLQAALREADWLGRWGGEEFLVVLPACELQQAADVMERVRTSLAGAPLQLADQELRLTASVGVTMVRAGSRDLDDAIAEADFALYQAKAAGRNCVRRFEPATAASA